jgi:oligopeptide transport system substrate-binding protein
MFFRRSATYWGKDEVNIRTVSIPTVNDPNASVLALTSGGVDYVTDVVPDYRVRMWRQKQEYLERHARTIADARARGITDPLTIDRLLPPDPRLSMHVFPAFGTYFYNFNCAPALADGRPNVFADARLRKAFALCVDKEAITRDIRRMGEPVAATFIPANALPGYPTPDGLSFDPASAQRLFAQAFPAGPSAFPAVEILVNKDAGHDLIAQSVAKDWQKHLGVQVRLRIQEVKTFRESLKKGDYMVSRAAWFGDYFDPTTFLDLNRTGDGNNDRQYANPAYDALLDRAAGETDPRSRMELLSQAERMLVEEELPLIPLFQYVNMYLYDPHKVAGLSPHPRGEDQIWRVDILGDGIGADAPGVYEGFGP